MRGAKPWRVERTNLGESMGYDRDSVIVDAHGGLITVIDAGHPGPEGRREAEQLAREIVAAVNSRSAVEAEK